MPTISAKVVTARKTYVCGHYRCNKLIRPTEKYMRLYGYVDSDPPYVVKMCMACAKDTPDIKLSLAFTLEKAGKKGSVK